MAKQAYKNVDPEELASWSLVREAKNYAMHLGAKIEINTEKVDTGYVGSGVLILPDQEYRVVDNYWPDKEQLRSYIARGLILQGPEAEAFGQRITIVQKSSPVLELASFLTTYRLPRPYYLFRKIEEGYKFRVSASLDAMDLRSIWEIGEDYEGLKMERAAEIMRRLKLLRKTSSLEMLVAHRPEGKSAIDTIRSLRNKKIIKEFNFEVETRESILREGRKSRPFRASVTVDGFKREGPWTMRKATAREMAARAFFYAMKSKDRELYDMASEIAQG